jgi:cell division protein FtsB
MKAKVEFTKEFGDLRPGDNKTIRLTFARKLEARGVAKIVEVYDEKSREQLKKELAKLQEENTAMKKEIEKLKAEKKKAVKPPADKTDKDVKQRETK